MTPLRQAITFLTPRHHMLLHTYFALLNITAITQVSMIFWSTKILDLDSKNRITTRQTYSNSLSVSAKFVGYRYGSELTRFMWIMKNLRIQDSWFIILHNRIQTGLYSVRLCLFLLDRLIILSWQKHTLVTVVPSDYFCNAAL